jgi:hypothetical protein
VRPANQPPVTVVALRQEKLVTIDLVLRLRVRGPIPALHHTPSGCGAYRGADKSLARPGRKQATATEDFDVHVSYL